MATARLVAIVCFACKSVHVPASYSPLSCGPSSSFLLAVEVAAGRCPRTGVIQKCALASALLPVSSLHREGKFRAGMI